MCSLCWLRGQWDPLPSFSREEQKSTSRGMLEGKHGKRKWIFFLRNSRWASNFLLLSFTGAFMLYHVRMKRENVETRGQNCYNYGVWCKIHKNPQSLTVIAPTNLLYNKKIDSYKKRLRKSKKKEMPYFYRYLYNPNQQRNRKLWNIKAILY